MISLLLNGRTELVPAAQLADSDPLELIRWCYANARYGLVTTELVAWLRTIIDGRHAIEVGAGCGDLGFHLGIHMTDSSVQTSPEMRALYAILGQRVTVPPVDVERLDAAQAVAKHRPQVVVASWLTQRYQPGDRGRRTGSSIYGVDECALIESVETYVHIGNLRVHGDKRALRLPHRCYDFPWLWSRSQWPELNRIWVWDRAARA